MNNTHETSYALLVRSEEKGKGLAETMVYALLGLSAIISIWQFARQDSFAAPHLSRHHVSVGIEQKS